MKEIAIKEFYSTPHCVMCPNEIPADRRKHKAVTCSPICAEMWEKKRRERQDSRECRFCRKPSTPEQRAAYQRFTRLEKSKPHLLYPAEYEQWCKDQELFSTANKDAKKKFPINPDAFAKHWKEQRKILLTQKPAMGLD